LPTPTPTVTEFFSVIRVIPAKIYLKFLIRACLPLDRDRHNLTKYLGNMQSGTLCLHHHYLILASEICDLAVGLSILSILTEIKCAITGMILANLV
jgi:hypothetical protein